MAASAILDIPTIPGESNDEKFKGKIEIDNFNWGQSQSGSSQFGSGSGAGKVSFHDFSFTKHTDKSSPKLFEKCATGEHIPNATLILRKSGDMGGELVEFFRAEFTDLIVSSFQTSGHDGDAGLPTENISFNFSAVKKTYTIQEKGKPGGVISASHDVRQNITT